ncbi:MAG TPA: hypothetical protein PLQ36_00005, partial [Candidatus Gracilibacteria bacterium]|nr:hypothetical protein [Candidatus Gracilibacteria bacterium]
LENLDQEQVQQINQAYEQEKKSIAKLAPSPLAKSPLPNIKTPVLCGNNISRALKDLGVINKSLPSCMKIANKSKTESGYDQDIVSASSIYQYSSSKKLVIKRLKSTQKAESINFFDRENRPILQVDQYFATFYSYDQNSRIIEKLKVKPSLAWQEKVRIFQKPQVWNSKNEFKYVGTSDQVQSRLSYGENAKTPTKTSEYTYSGTKIRIIKILNSKSQTVAQVEFKYDSTGQLLMIQETKQKTTRHIMIAYRKLGEVLAQFPELKPIFESGSVWVADPQDFDPIYLVDADGTVLSEQIKLKRVAQNILSSRLVASTCGKDMSCFDDSVSTIDYTQYFKLKSRQTPSQRSSFETPTTNLDTATTSQIPAWGDLQKKFQNPQDYQQCLQKFLELGNKEVDFTTELLLQKLKISKTSRESFITQINQGKAKCPEVGLPISDPIKMQFGKTQHVFWPSSQGVKFYSAGKYNFWISKTAIAKKMGVSETKIKLDQDLGTYISPNDQGKLVYSPKLTPQSSAVYQLNDETWFAWLKSKFNRVNLGFPISALVNVGQIKIQKFCSDINLNLDSTQKAIIDNTFYWGGVSYQVIDDALYNTISLSAKLNGINIDEIPNWDFQKGRQTGNQAMTVLSLIGIEAGTNINKMGISTLGVSGICMVYVAPAVTSASLAFGPTGAIGAGVSFTSCKAIFLTGGAIVVTGQVVQSVSLGINANSNQNQSKIDEAVRKIQDYSQTSKLFEKIENLKDIEKIVDANKIPEISKGAKVLRGDKSVAKGIVERLKGMRWIKQETNNTNVNRYISPDGQFAINYREFSSSTNELLKLGYQHEATLDLLKLDKISGKAISNQEVKFVTQLLGQNISLKSLIKCGLIFLLQD